MNQQFTHTNFPFSVSFADDHTFSAKERDTETGFSYFGARYYSSDLSIWLSLDPMSDKYPSLSPYVYCANNPVKLVDPNGEKIGDFSDGVDGDDGPSGVSGMVISAGLSGVSGDSGVTGIVISAGLAGVSGDSGVTGMVVSAGLAGVSGDSGATGMVVSA